MDRERVRIVRRRREARYNTMNKKDYTEIEISEGMFGGLSIHIPYYGFIQSSSSSKDPILAALLTGRQSEKLNVYGDRFFKVHKSRIAKAIKEYEDIKNNETEK